MLFKNDTPYLFGYKACATAPPQPQISALVRAKFRLTPGQPLLPFRDDAVDADTLSRIGQDGDAEAAAVEHALLLLGQGALRADSYAPGDDRQQGEVLYPSDFADYKPRADVMLRGRCFPPHESQQCDVAFSVGSWRKTLGVVGTQLRLDDLPGGKTEPRAFRSMAVDYAHAFGGPSFANNPIGKGAVLDADGGATTFEDIYLPPRSERSLVMAAQQLPNILHADGRAQRDGLAAGFGPLSPTWPYRSAKRGKQYDESWRNTRAPYYAVDFDWSFFNAAPPDQQLERLRGDEEVSFEHLHPTARKFSVMLPALRLRVFLLDDKDRTQELTMRLDTLFADLDEGALYLTWRGLGSARRADLADIAFGLIVSEPLAAPKSGSRVHLERLRAFAADPVGLDQVMPAELMDAAALGEQLDNPDSGQIEQLLHRDGEDDPVSALLGNLGSIAGGAHRQARDALGVALAGAPQQQLRQSVVDALSMGRAPGAPASLGRDVRRMRTNLRDIEAAVGPNQQLTAAREALTAVGDDPMGDDADSPEDYGPGAQLAGCDLSWFDLSGRDLSGADLRGALLDGTNLSGALLVGANLSGAQLHRTQLSGADLSQALLCEASLYKVRAERVRLLGAKLDMSQWNKVDLSEACLDGVHASAANLNDCRLVGVSAVAAQFERCNLDQCSLDDADFTAASLPATGFRQCSALQLNLAKARLDGTSFKGCDLKRAKLQRARGDKSVWMDAALEAADFSYCYLPGANFVQAACEYAQFRGARLVGSRFDGAALRHADFSKANLMRAVLCRAGLDRTNFEGAQLFEADLSETRGRHCDVSSALIDRTLFERSELRR